MQNVNFQAAIQLVLKASQDGKPQHEAVLVVCDSPQYLVDAGFPQLPIVIKGSTVDKAHFDHGVTKGMLERLGEIIHHPKALYRSSTHPASRVVVAFELKGNSPLLVPLHPDQQIGRSSRFNTVASVYCKEPNVEQRWLAKGLLIWTPPPNKKSPDYSTFRL